VGSGGGVSFEEELPRSTGDTLCALAAEKPPANRGRGLAAEILRAMRVIGACEGLQRLIAPVRPSLKDRYLLAAIERYLTWRRGDGTHLDLWLRVHEQLGARIGPSLPNSMRISGAVAEWEDWTGLLLPESGEYVFPQGLGPLHVDRARDVATYWEPNIWMIHPDIGPLDATVP